MPAITILTPVWNGLPYLRECVESVLAQDFTDWELVISDNGSTDGTRDYLDTLKDPRIRIFKQERNLGIYGNLNFLFAQPRAEIAYILCADDYFLSAAALTTAITLWKEQPPETGFVRCNWGEVRDGAALSRRSYAALPKHIQPSSSDLAFFLFGNLPGNLSNMLVRVACVKEVGGFLETLPYAGDFEMWTRVGRNFPFTLSDVQIAYVRRHEGVASNYLNRKGEVFPQLVFIYATLMENLAPKIPRGKLKAFFNAEIVSSHLRTGILALSRGKPDYFKRVMSTVSPVLWSLPARFAGCIPLSLWQTGRQRLALRMASQLGHFTTAP